MQALWIVWKVPKERISEVGETLGAFPQVSHCYERPSYPDWPYNVFSMIHCTTKKEAHEVAETIQKQVDVAEYMILFSLREFKKIRVEYLWKIRQLKLDEFGYEKLVQLVLVPGSVILKSSFGWKSSTKFFDRY